MGRGPPVQVRLRIVRTIWNIACNEKECIAHDPCSKPCYLWGKQTGCTCSIDPSSSHLLFLNWPFSCDLSGPSKHAWQGLAHHLSQLVQPDRVWAGWHLHTWAVSEGWAKEKGGRAQLGIESLDA